MHEAEWRKTLKSMKWHKNNKKKFKKNPDYVFLGHFWPKLLKWKAKSRLVFMENNLSVEVTFLFLSSYLVFPEGQGRLMLVQVLLNELMNLQHCQFFTPEGMPLHEAMSLQKCIHCDSAIFISEIAERDTSLEQIHWYP